MVQQIHAQPAIKIVHFHIYLDLHAFRIAHHNMLEYLMSVINAKLHAQLVLIQQLNAQHVINLLQISTYLLFNVIKHALLEQFLIALK